MGWTTPFPREGEPGECARLLARMGHEPLPVRAPDLPLVRATFQALMAAGPGALAHGWRLSQRGASHTARVAGQAITLQLEANSEADAERVLAGLSPLVLDVLALLVDVGHSGARAPARIVRLSDVMQAKGSRRWGDERRSLARRLSDEFQALRRLSTGDGGALLFDLTPIDNGQEAFVYQPGEWLRDERVGRRDLDRRLLQLDHRPNRGADVLAKKLGIYFSLIVRDEAPVVRPVSAVLRAIGAADPNLASRSGRGGRLAERFDEALLRLGEQELFAVRYRGGDGGWEDDRGKGRIKRWTAAELVIRRPVGSSSADRPSASAWSAGWN
jgi:hypothetical protein